MYQNEIAWGAHTHLYNSRITGEPMLGFGWLRHSDVFDVTSSEDDVIVNFIFGRHRSVCVSVLCSIGLYCQGWGRQAIHLIRKSKDLFYFFFLVAMSSLMY